MCAVFFSQSITYFRKGTKCCDFLFCILILHGLGFVTLLYPIYEHKQLIVRVQLSPETQRTKSIFSYPSCLVLKFVFITIYSKHGSYISSLDNMGQLVYNLMKTF